MLATKMLNALNHDAYNNTDYIEFTFKNRHHYKWHKSEQRCEVYWRQYKIELDLKNTSNSKVFIGDAAYEGDDINQLIKKAQDYFNNDSFWLVAPYKVYDHGVETQVSKNRRR